MATAPSVLSWVLLVGGTLTGALMIFASGDELDWWAALIVGLIIIGASWGAFLLLQKLSRSLRKRSRPLSSVPSRQFMLYAKNSTVVNAPVQRVFRYVATYGTGGKMWRKAKQSGLRLVDSIENQLLIFELATEIGNFRYSFKFLEFEDRTKVTMRMSIGLLSVGLAWGLFAPLIWVSVLFFWPLSYVIMSLLIRVLYLRPIRAKFSL